MAESKQHEFSIDFTPNPIKCLLFSPAVKPDCDAKTTAPSMIFTHGAGGTLKSDAIANFSSGFSLHSSILCFQGNSNLKSRGKMFSTVIEDQKFSICLGGRSMGARAAVMAAADDTKYLVLVSYPLQTAKEVRDQILLDLPLSMEVIFVSGDGDSMCSMERLDQVRTSMKCKSWRIIVTGADHGMSVKPKKATEEVGRKTGEVVAAWLQKHSEAETEGIISWNAEEEKVDWSGWTSSTNIPHHAACDEVKLRVEKPVPSSRSMGQRKSASKKADRPVDHDAISTRTRKRKSACKDEL